MFGNYQHSDLRIEISASANDISESLTTISKLEQWLWPQQLKVLGNAPVSTAQPLNEGQTFSSSLGLVQLTHQVETASPTAIRFLLSGSIDGFHEWQWGDGWVQSRLEGVSLLPLNLAQSLSLMRLKQHLKSS